MSKVPFSRHYTHYIVGGLHRKKDFSLNFLLIGRQPKAKPSHLLGIVVVALLLLILQLTACGNTASPLGSASPTSNSTSQSSTPSTSSSSVPGSTSASTTTAGPNTGPTTGPTTGPAVEITAPPSSFTVGERQFDFTGSAGQSDPDAGHITLNNSSNRPLFWSVSVAPDNAKAWLSLKPSSDKLLGSKQIIDLIASNLKAHLPPGFYEASLVWNPVNPDPNVDNSVKVTLTVVPSVSKVSPANGPAAGGTSVIITGSGFTGATGVSFGSTALNPSDFIVNSDTQITATSPAGSGMVKVTVTTPNGSASAQFTYK